MRQSLFVYQWRTLAVRARYLGTAAGQPAHRRCTQGTLLDLLVWLTVPHQLSPAGWPPSFFPRSPKIRSTCDIFPQPNHRQIRIAHSKMSPAAGANEKESNLARVLGSGTKYLCPAGVARARKATARPIYSAIAHGID